MVVFHSEAVVKRRWKNSSMKSQEMGPDSAGSTAVMGTELREIHWSFAVGSGFEGTNHEFSLLNWAGLCFHCYSCAPAAQKAIWALWEWICQLIQVQLPQNKMISVSILIMHCKKHLWVDWCPWHAVAICAAGQYRFLWFLTHYGNAVMLGEIVLQRDLACCLLWRSAGLMAVQGHQSNSRPVRPQVL